MPLTNQKPINSKPLRPLYLAATLWASLALSGCSYLIGSATGGLADNLSQGVLNNEDIVTVEKGLPAYLLLIDGLLEGSPNNTGLLTAAASLNSAYAGAFAGDPDHAQTLSNKAFAYAQKAACLKRKQACGLKEQSFGTFESNIAAFRKKDIDVLYTLGASWASWIETNSGDLNAVGDISRVKVIMERVAALDEGYQQGTVYIYLGTLATLLPPSVGGKPEVGRAYFEQALNVSEGRNLMAKTTYARRYARMLFNRELHDKLLNEVLAADPKVEGLTLINRIAQKQAQDLLASADDYF